MNPYARFTLFLFSVLALIAANLYTYALVFQIYVLGDFSNVPRF